MGNKFIFSQMFDVRPRTKEGKLDLEKIEKIQAILDLRQKEIIEELTEELEETLEPKSIEREPVLENVFPDRDYLLQKLEQIEQLESKLRLFGGQPRPSEEKQEDIQELLDLLKAPAEEVRLEPKISPVSAHQIKEPLTDVLEPEIPVRSWRKPLLGFVACCVLLSLVVPGLGLVKQGLAVKVNVLSSSLEAYRNFYLARDSISQADITGAKINFEKAWQNFLSANNEIEKLGSGIVSVLEAMPGGATISSGRHLVKIGENLALAGKSLAEASEIIATIGPSTFFDKSSAPLTQKGGQIRNLLVASQSALSEANLSFKKVKITSLPENIQEETLLIKEKLPEVVQLLDFSIAWTDTLLEILGHQKAKKYLLVFQNNSELRPTGGFIGSYGIVDLDRGKIKSLLVNGIFDIDGQLYEKIIPPRPIQKISTAWSTHDANWFADFPTSAKKITWFFEKTGEATVDGVIALTPTVIEELLRLTGPITMPSYGVTLNSDNFVELTQYKIEVDYDKEQNQPKKILADFAPLLLEKLGKLSLKDLSKLFEIFNQALLQKQILFYFIDEEIQQIFENQGWAGKIEEAPRDYLNVINTNICGYKTDRVMKQKIKHQINIEPDGSVIDTLTIIRQHQGGNEKYDWWNRVNANYLRVYVPLGSKLLSASGQILEAYSPPIDYQAQGFKSDPDVSAQEASLKVDSLSGTQIFEESSKTVFANWLYTSPGKTSTIVYRYQLPFKLDLQKAGEDYSILIQKQPGLDNSSILVEIGLPPGLEVGWHHPNQMLLSNQALRFESEFDSDKFLGLILNLNR